MDIGTAKIMPEEMEGVDHYLVDVLDPKDEFHVARFQQMAKEALECIYAKGQIPIIVGGTDFIYRHCCTIYSLQIPKWMKVIERNWQKLHGKKAIIFCMKCLQKLIRPERRRFMKTMSNE